MKRLTRILLFAAVVTALLVCFAFAVGTATDGWTTANDDCVVTRDSATGKYTVSYTETGLSGEYALLVVKGTADSYTISADTIVYIDQKAAAENKVEIEDFIPLAEPDCVVLLGGTFQDQGPKVLGTIIGHGVSVKGTVTSYDPKQPATVSLYLSSDTAHATVKYTAAIPAEGTGSGQKTQSFEIPGVEAGTYDLVVTKAGHADFILTGVVVESTEVDLSSKNAITLLAGDLNEDDMVNVTDCGVITNGENYNKPVASAAKKQSDLNGDGLVNVTDLGVVTNGANYNKGTAQNATVAFQK